MNRDKDIQPELFGSEPSMLPVIEDKPRLDLNDGPGYVLRKARLQAGLKEQDVAKKLKLSVQLVHAIENDEYTLLPAPAYTRGYLRSYARLVKCPEQEILVSYDSQAPAVEKVDINRLNLVKDFARQPSYRRNIKWRYVFAGLAVIALLLIWMGGDGGETESSDNELTLPLSIANGV